MSFVSLLCPKTKFKRQGDMKVRSSFDSHELETFLLCNKYIIDQACPVKVAGYKPCSFQSVFMDLNAWSVKHAVYNGNRTEWNPIQSVIIPVINKI